MFNVSFKVGEDMLANALERLRPVTDSFSVVPLDGESLDISSGKITSGKPVPLATFGEEKPVANFGIQANANAPEPKKRRSYKKRRPHFGTQRSRAHWLLLQIGVQPIKVSDLLDQAIKVGVSKDALYAAIADHIKRGQLSRLGYGRYQRTGQSFAESLGLAENAA